MNSVKVRSLFFDYFSKQNHTHVSSSPLIPAQDPTLLFANAGMNQFKDLFLGKEKRSYTRAVSIQKCMRAGGKHNDLDAVGFTRRHLTFFEMMGNFSFGDYFKQDAIKFAWEFVTNALGMPADKIHVTVYLHDEESYNIWHTLAGVPKERIHKLGAADNFWQMGDTGPCGPCTELYIDQGTSIGCNSSQCAPGCSCDRFLEFWNLVFMQFDRQPDGTDVPLAQPGVDTGMGLERLCAILQKKESVFETDLFVPMIEAIEKASDVSYHKSNADLRAAFHVIADHARAATFAIMDGCSPSNEGRGYVLRKIIRRAALFSSKLSEKSLLVDASQAVITHMHSIYQELLTQKNRILSVIESEVEKFAANLASGEPKLRTFIQSGSGSVVPGAFAFKLYDTYGFPLELTELIAREHGWSVDKQSFEEHMEQQKISSGKKQVTPDAKPLEVSAQTEFIGYSSFDAESTIEQIICGSQPVEAAGPGQECWIITERSPFYVECGGQVSDTGTITIENHSTAVLELKKIGAAIAAKIVAPIELSVGMTVTQTVDSSTRLATMKNHTATHLLQAALIQVLGSHVKQAGSLVHPDYLRFDFTHHENLTQEQVEAVERLVNQKIMENISVSVEQSTLESATKNGVIAFFGEKYNPEQVRVVSVPGFSAELCGGTHVRATGDIGCFKITKVTGLLAGQRRIFAVTGPKAVELYQQLFAANKELATRFNVSSEAVVTAVEKQGEELKVIQQTLKKVKSALWHEQLQGWIKTAEKIGSHELVFVTTQFYDVAELKEIVTEALKKHPAFYFFANIQGTTLQFICSWPSAISIDATKLSTFLKEKAALRSGGKSTTIQGTGTSVGLDIKGLLKEFLSKC